MVYVNLMTQIGIIAKSNGIDWQRKNEFGNIADFILSQIFYTDFIHRFFTNIKTNIIIIKKNNDNNNNKIIIIIKYVHTSYFND